MEWLRKGLPPHHVALAMVGARPGQQILIAGAAVADVAAEIAVVTGLNGRTLVLDASPDAGARLERAAAAAGALVDLEPQALDAHPLPAGFDIVILNREIGRLDHAGRARLCAHALGALRPGGRMVAIEGVSLPGRFGLGGTRKPGLPSSDVRALLENAGAIAVRELADVDGVTYCEGQKPAKTG